MNEEISQPTGAGRHTTLRDIAIADWTAWPKNVWKQYLEQGGQPTSKEGQHWLSLTNGQRQSLISKWRSEVVRPKLTANTPSTRTEAPTIIRTLAKRAEFGDFMAHTNNGIHEGPKEGTAHIRGRSEEEDTCHKVSNVQQTQGTLQLQDQNLRHEQKVLPMRSSGTPKTRLRGTGTPSRQVSPQETTEGRKSAECAEHRNGAIAGQSGRAGFNPRQTVKSRSGDSGGPSPSQQKLARATGQAPNPSHPKGAAAEQQLKTDTTQDILAKATGTKFQKVRRAGRGAQERRKIARALNRAQAIEADPSEAEIEWQRYQREHSAAAKAAREEAYKRLFPWRGEDVIDYEDYRNLFYPLRIQDAEKYRRMVNGVRRQIKLGRIDPLLLGEANKSEIATYPNGRPRTINDVSADSRIVGKHHQSINSYLLRSATARFNGRRAREESGDIDISRLYEGPVDGPKLPTQPQRNRNAHRQHSGYSEYLKQYSGPETQVSRGSRPKSAFRKIVRAINQ